MEVEVRVKLAESVLRIRGRILARAVARCDYMRKRIVAQETALAWGNVDDFAGAGRVRSATVSGAFYVPNPEELAVDSEKVAESIEAVIDSPTSKTIEAAMWQLEDEYYRGVFGGMDGWKSREAEEYNSILENMVSASKSAR